MPARDGYQVVLELLADVAKIRAQITPETREYDQYRIDNILMEAQGIKDYMDAIPASRKRKKKLSAKQKTEKNKKKQKKLFSSLRYPQTCA